MMRSWLTCILGIIAISAFAEAPGTVVLFDGKSPGPFHEKEFRFEDGLLRGSGMLRTNQRYNNFEMRLRYRMTKRFSPVRFGDGIVPEGAGRGKLRKLGAAQVGKWRDLHVLVRDMPDEKIMIANLTPLAGDAPVVTYGGNSIKYAPKNDRKIYEIGKNGFIPDGGRVDLFFDTPTEIQRLTIAPLSPTNARDYLAIKGKELAEAVKAGGEVYKVNCTTCHGDGVGKAPNPLARSFATDAIANGADAQSLFNTMTKGYNNMPPMASLSVEQRYQVVHYLREKILKPNNKKAYVPIMDEYLESLPYPLYSLAEKRERANRSPDTIAKETGRFRDHGPAMVCTNKRKRNALQVKLAGETTISYNLHNMSSLGVWHGAFMEMLGSHYYVGKGNRQPTSIGVDIPELGGWKWAHGGKIDYAEQPDNGPMTTPGFRFNGYYLHNDTAILNYQFENRKILETPQAVIDGDSRVLIQHVEVGAGDKPVSVAIAASAEQLQGVAIALVGDVESARLNGAAITVAPGGKAVRFAVLRGVGPKAAEMVKALAKTTKVADFAKLKQGGERRWPKTYTAAGTVAADEGVYVVDTLPVPYENDYNAWMRTTSLAFFDDGRAAVTTYDGDVWIVSGIDKELKNVTWSRFASGLHEGFGCQIVDGQIYVGARNGIVRLHDYNKDGEADYYEQFFCDPDFSFTYHGYNFDLIRDKDGYFYYSKNGQFADISYDGGCVKISPDGKKWEHYGRGFRTPNGMGILPDGRILMGDNQGAWVPAGKVSVIEPGKWYGGATKGHNPVPETFEQPIIWLPQEVDNSCGGQVWVDDARFGPYGKGALFHTSCGSGRAMMLFLDEVGGTTQAAVWRFPQQFDSGIMRPRVNPTDGQVYVTGTRGWGVKAPKDGCLQRVRYTGRKEAALTGVKARAGRIEMTFSDALPVGNVDAGKFAASQWNYLWSRTYGSKKYSVKDPKVTEPDVLAVTGVDVSPDRRTMTVKIPELGPAHQVRLDYLVPGGAAETIHLTIHALE
jgi:mono/diheme cytochrome c family protein/glucose/arabinose dehydrogenase